MNYYNYFTEIEEAFVRRRGRNLLLSPLDWSLIEGWQEQGVPLHIVLRAIESVFDGLEKKHGAQLRSIKSISYCKEEIEVQYVEWLQSRTGSAEEVLVKEEGTLTGPGVSEHITQVIVALEGSVNENLREDLHRACARLEELRANMADDFERVEKVLTDIENFIDRALLTKSDKAHLNDLEKEIAGHIAGYRAGMGEETYKRTLDLMLLKRLREEEGVPPLSLFYL